MSYRCLVGALLICCGLARAARAESDLVTSVKQTRLRSALAVTIGCDASTDLAILEAAPDWLLLSMPGDPTTAVGHRPLLAKSAPGRVVVQPVLTDTIPLFPRTAALIVINVDKLGDQAPSQSEIDRVLRPYGMAWIKRGGKWTSTTGGWPDTIADYPHWLGGPGLAAQVPDKEISEVRSLRWQNGRNEETGRTLIVADGIAVTQMAVPGDRSTALVGLDAFTGLKLWARDDLSAGGNYALVMDAERVVVPLIPEVGAVSGTQREEAYAKLAREGKLKPIAIDAKTGETLITYSQAPSLQPPDRRASARDASFNLYQGKLIVIVGGELAVLDAKNGKRLWDVKHDGAMLFPTVADGRLVVALGAGTADTRGHGRYDDADVIGIESIVAYEIATGRELWKHQPGESANTTLTMLNQNAGSVWLDYDVQRKDWYLIRLDPADGKVIWKTKHSELGPTDQYARCFVFQKTVLLSRGAHDGYMFDLQTGEPLSHVRNGKWSVMQGGCHAPRASATHMFHSAVSMTGDAPHQFRWSHTIAGRCHLGAFPAHGMLLGSDSGCNCDPFIRGLAAYGSDEPPEILRTVTITGPGRPGRQTSGDAWRTAFRDAQRTAWSEAPLADAAAQKWSADLSGESPSALIASQWNVDITADVIGAPAIADDVVVVTRPHLHEVVALEPDDGAVRWRYHAAGRVDGSVTLAGGMAVFGSATGWVEAVSITDGRLVWMTQVAPGTRFRIRSGQVECSHPLLGTVAVVGDRVYASGGTHTHIDGGIHFVTLDLATGRLMDRTIYDGLPPAMDVETKLGPHEEFQPSPQFSRTEEGKRGPFLAIAGTYPSQSYSLAYQEQQNGPLVLTPEGWLGLGTLAYDPRGKAVKLGGIDLPFVSTGHNGHLHKNEARWPQQVRVGLLSRVRGNDSRNDEKAILAGIQARAFAYRGDDILTAYAGTSGNWSGRDKFRIARHRWRDKPLVEYTNERSSTKDEVSAEMLWSVKTGQRSWPRENLVATALAATRNRAIVAEEKTLYVYDIDTGEEVQKFDLPADVPAAGIAVAGGFLIVTCTDGSVHAFE